MHARHRLFACVELRQERRSGLLLFAGWAVKAEERAGAEEICQREQPVERCAMVRWREAHQRVDVLRAAQEPQVVARHHAALRMADQVHLAGAGRAEHPRDEAAELFGRLGDIARGVDANFAAAFVGAVVECKHAVAVVGEQRRQCLPAVGHVREGPVHQYHRQGMRFGRLAGEVVGAGRAGRRAGLRVAEDAVVDDRQFRCL